MGSFIQRKTTIREMNLFQHKDNGVEKPLGSIQSIARIENTYKGKHQGKITLETTVLKEGKKPRVIVLLFSDVESLNKVFNYWKINRESAKTSLNTTMRHVAKNFRSAIAVSFQKQLQKMYKAKNIQNEKDKQKKQDQEVALRQVFNGLDRKFAADFIEKWRIAAIERQKEVGDLELMKKREQEEQDLKRKLQKMQDNQQLKSFDKKVIEQYMGVALQNSQMKKSARVVEEEEFNNNQKLKSIVQVQVKGSAPPVDQEDDEANRRILSEIEKSKFQGEEGATIDFKSVILPSNMNFIRPVMEVVYTVVPYGEIEINDNTISRMICNQKWNSNIEEIKDIPKNSNNNTNNNQENNNNSDNSDIGKLLLDQQMKQLEQQQQASLLQPQRQPAQPQQLKQKNYGTSKIAYRQYFQCRLSSKLSEVNNEWVLKPLKKNTQLYDKVLVAGGYDNPNKKQELPAAIEEEQLILELNKSQNDYMKIRIFESFNQTTASAQKTAQTIQEIIQVSDLSSIQSRTKKVWISINSNQSSQQPSKPTGQSPSPQANSTSASLSMTIFREPDVLEKNPNDFQEFLAQLSEKTQLEIIDPLYLSFLPTINFTSPELHYFLQKLQREQLCNQNSLILAQFIVSQASASLPKSIVKDGKNLFFNIISKHLTSEYFQFSNKSKQIQEELLSKASQEDKSVVIAEIINNINSQQESIFVKDLRQLLSSGVPQTYRSLYWYNFLQLKETITADQSAYNRTFNNNELPRDNSKNEIRSSELLYLNYKYYLSNGDKSISLIKNESQRKILGLTLSTQLDNVISAFAGYLKVNRIADLHNEQQINITLAQFITKVFISFHPTFMSTAQPFSQLDFINQKNFPQNNTQVDNNTDTNTNTTRKTQTSPMKKRATQADGEWRQLAELSAAEEKLKSTVAEGEIFWFIVALYNLHFRDMVQIHDPENLQQLKYKITRGVLAYEQLLDDTSLDIISKNNLTEIIQTFWVENYTSFFDGIISSFAFTKILDLFVFEFGLNLVDGFETAIQATFITLLQRINLSEIHNEKELQSACIIESLLFPKDFIDQIYKNIDRISKTLDVTLLENRAEALPFSQLVEHLYPNILQDYNSAEKKRKQLFETNAHSIMMDVDEFLNKGPSQPYQSHMLNSNSKNVESLHKLLPNKNIKLLASNNYNIDRRIFSDSHQDQLNQHKDYQQNYAVKNLKSFMPQKDDEQ